MSYHQIPPQPETMVGEEAKGQPQKQIILDILSDTSNTCQPGHTVKR
jgi:hypothetical protein